MRRTGLAMLAALWMAPAHAAPPKNSPDAIVCNFSGDCEVGPEKGFSLRASSAPTARPATTASKAKPASRPSPAAVAAKPAGGPMDMRITFNLGSAELTEQGKAEARAFAQAMQSPKLATMKFSVDGHTDAIGNREYNLDLSRRRAQSVVDFLVAQGADPSRLQPQGHGFDQPRAGLGAKDPGNRRVEFARAN